MQEVQAIDLLDRGLADAAGAGALHDQVEKPVALSFFESLRPSIGRSGCRMTAAATKGPASGPRPASSTLAVRISGAAIADLDQ